MTDPKYSDTVTELMELRLKYHQLEEKYKDEKAERIRLARQVELLTPKVDVTKLPESCVEGHV